MHAAVLSDNISCPPVRKVHFGEASCQFLDYGYRSIAVSFKPKRFTVGSIIRTGFITAGIPLRAPVLNAPFVPGGRAVLKLILKRLSAEFPFVGLNISPDAQKGILALFRDMEQIKSGDPVFEGVYGYEVPVSF